MQEFEQQVRDGLKKVPGKGFTQDLQAEVVRGTEGLDPMQPSRPRRRSYTSLLAMTAAVAVVVGGVFTYDETQRGADQTILFNSTSAPPVTTPPPTEKPALYVLEQNTTQLLSKYGWTPQYADQQIQTLTLPKSYVDEPGAYPLGLYWAYHNVLSKDIGLDMTQYLGQRVAVHMIPVQHWTIGVPYLDENRTTYAIVVAMGNQVVGAWISQGLNGSDFAASLSKHFFASLTGQTWDTWLQSTGIVDYSKGVDAARRNWTPEQVIKAYFNALDKKDYQTAWSLMTKSSQYSPMSINLPDGKLYNNSFDGDGYGEHNITSVKVTNIQLLNLPPYTGTNSTDDVGMREQQIEHDLFNMKTYAQHEYKVDVIETYKQVIARGNGPGTWYVGVVKESSNAPWKISGYGSGP